MNFAALFVEKVYAQIQKHFSSKDLSDAATGRTQEKTSVYLTLSFNSVQFAFFHCLASISSKYCGGVLTHVD